MENNHSEASKASASSNTTDNSLYEHTMSLYDNLPYKRDSDMCNSKYLVDHGSQIIHSYSYNTEPYKVPAPKDE